MSKSKLLCENCKDNMLIAYRVFNWNDDNSDRYFDNLKESKIYYKK